MRLRLHVGDETVIDELVQCEPLRLRGNREWKVVARAQVEALRGVGAWQMSVDGAAKAVVIVVCAWP